mgnify:CR=1 FL=1
MAAILFFLPIIGGMVLISIILIFISKILSSKKHYYSWITLVMLITFLSMTAYSLLGYINIL